MNRFEKRLAVLEQEQRSAERVPRMRTVLVNACNGETAMAALERDGLDLEALRAGSGERPCFVVFVRADHELEYPARMAQIAQQRAAAFEGLAA